MKCNQLYYKRAAKSNICKGQVVICINYVSQTRYYINGRNIINVPSIVDYSKNIINALIIHSAI